MILPESCPSAHMTTLLGLAVGAQAQRLGIRLGLAESCTGGLASSWVTGISGSSQWFEGGVVSYSNALKTRLLGVPPDLLDRNGAVSGPVAQAMAEGLANILSATAPAVSGWATASITGIAGPAGAMPGKPVGLVWFGWVIPGRPTCLESRVFSGSRQSVQYQAAWWALSGLAAGLASLQPPA